MNLKQEPTDFSAILGLYKDSPPASLEVLFVGVSPKTPSQLGDAEEIF